MIVFDLECTTNGHRFEGWFGSSTDFADQQARGLVACPICNSGEVTRAISAPNIGRKSNQRTERGDQPAKTAEPAPTPMMAPAVRADTPLPPQTIAALKTIAKLQAEALKSSTWVGKRFADNARAMHYGETDAAPIHGEATVREVQALVDEGVEIAPILIPIAPPKDLN